MATTTTDKLSLLPAILININIMIGSGLFINTVLLAQNAGTASPMVYALLGLLIYPLIASFTQLLTYHPGGNFYDFAEEINPFSGFLSLWSYFITKMASATLGIHVCVSLLQTIFPLLKTFNALTLDCIIITLFIGLNTLNMKIGKSIQYSFVLMKLIPIIFAIIGGAALFNSSNLISHASWSQIMTAIPFALYALTGFEAICSLGQKIENPKKNGPLAVIFSFFTVVGILFVYQLMFCAALGPELGNLSSYLDAFPALIKKLIPNTNLHHTVQTILHAGIAASALGVAYGIIYSNSWNLHNLGKRNLIFAAKTFEGLNKHRVPVAAVLAEGFLAYSYILITGGNQIPFQQIAAIGLTLTYSLSCLGLIVHTWKTAKKLNITGLFGIISCLLLFYFQAINFYIYGIKNLLVFLSMMAIGSIMFLIKRRTLTNFKR